MALDRQNNVWIHTRMVLETLLDMPAFRALPPAERDVVFVACVLATIGYLVWAFGSEG